MRSVVTKKSVKKAETKAGTPSPKEKLKFKPKDNDWYEAAFKRFSISQNRSEQRRDVLASLSPPIKPGLQ